MHGVWIPAFHVVSPASLLDSQHGCIASPHAKKESGQTPYAVWSPLVQEFLGQGSGFDCCGVWFLFIFADSATTFADSARPNYQRSLIHPCCESRRLAGETTFHARFPNRADRSFHTYRRVLQFNHYGSTVSVLAGSITLEWGSLITVSLSHHPN